MGCLSHLNDFFQIRNELPEKDRKISPLKVFITGSYGAMASLVGVLSVDPNGYDKIILTAILSGYLGETLIASAAYRNFNAARNKTLRLDEEIEYNKNNDV